MTGEAGDSPDTAGTDPLREAVLNALLETDAVYLGGGQAQQIADQVVAAVRAHQNTTGQDERNDRDVGYLSPVDGSIVTVEELRDATAPLREHAHQNTTGQYTAAQALRDAADAIDEHPAACLSGYRVHDDEDSDADCSHCIAADLRARADALDAAGEDEDLKTVSRCQHKSPSPWGLTQCVLPDGHDGRHAHDPSEGAS